MDIIMYEKPTCSKCRETAKLLEEAGVPFEPVRFHDAPISAEKLADLIKKMGIAPRDLLRTSEQIYRELELARKDVSDDELTLLMVEHPDLMQRPIVERGDRAVLARPPERVLELIGEAA